VTYGGDSGNRISVLYWRCSLIRVSVTRGSTVSLKPRIVQFFWNYTCVYKAVAREVYNIKDINICILSE
jgi:hypothetical protein